MLDLRERFLGSTCLLALLATQGTAQEAARWIDDLGDPERSEAAEIALLAHFEANMASLGKLLEAWDATTARDVARLRAALRVVELAGTEASDLLPHLLSAGRLERPRLTAELRAAVISLLGTTQNDHQSVVRVLLSRGGPVPAEAEQVQAARGFARMDQRIDDAAAARTLLATDQFGAREGACDVLACLGDASDVAALRDRLLDRDRPAAKGICHNGFAVPAEDAFRLRAALAMLRLAPTSPDTTIAHATLAVLHPHRTIRMRSLRALSAHGPDVAQAIPELLTVARGIDEELAVAALHALLPAAASMASHWADLDTLGASGRPRVAGAAARLVAQLQARGVERPQPSAAAAVRAREDDELRSAVAALSDDANDATKAATARLIEAGPRSWPFLVDRYRRELQGSPDRLLDLIGSVGRMLPDEKHVEVREALSNAGDFWLLGGMPSFHSKGEKLRPAAIQAYGRLVIGPPTMDRQVAALGHENPIVRLVGARELAANPSAVAAAAAKQSPECADARAALVQAACALHPAKAEFRWKNHSTTTPLDLAATIRAHAAAALIECTVPKDKAPILFRCLKDLDDASTAARALAHWADGFDTDALRALVDDQRTAVATTAKRLLATRLDR